MVRQKQECVVVHDNVGICSRADTCPDAGECPAHAKLHELGELCRIECKFEDVEDMGGES